MTSSRPILQTMVAAAALCLGCGCSGNDPVKIQTSYRTLQQAEDAFAARDYPAALALFDDAIKSAAMQADFYAEAHAKRAVCKVETGDFEGAEKDLATADQGGAVGEEYQMAKRLLALKRKK